MRVRAADVRTITADRDRGGGGKSRKRNGQPPPLVSGVKMMKHHVWAGTHEITYKYPRMITREKCAKAAIKYMNETPYREHAVLRLIGEAFMAGCDWMAEQKQKEDEAKIDIILKEMRTLKNYL